MHSFLTGSQISPPCLLPLSLLLLLTSSHLVLGMSEQFIVFDQVGQMASSMAYIHVAIPLNLSHFKQQVLLFRTHMANLANFTRTQDSASVRHSTEQLLAVVYPQIRTSCTMS